MHKLNDILYLPVALNEETDERDEMGWRSDKSKWPPN
jgi:hypothetical protein